MLTNLVITVIACIFAIFSIACLMTALWIHKNRHLIKRNQEIFNNKNDDHPFIRRGIVLNTRTNKWITTRTLSHEAYDEFKSVSYRDWFKWF